MTTKQTIIYITEDGKEFTKEADAITHEQCIAIMQVIEDSDNTPALRLDQLKTIALVILEKFTLTPR